MINDVYTRQILTENDLCNAYLTNPEIRIKTALVETQVLFDRELNLTDVPELLQYIPDDSSVEEFDKTLQDNWYIPLEYKNMDIAQWVLNQCREDYELQRVGEELLLFQERNLFPLLCYCKFLVDTMRKNNVVWGVGRGSSVASYVLYLIGVHRINSLHYDLSIDEFLK